MPSVACCLLRPAARAVAPDLLVEDEEMMAEAAAQPHREARCGDLACGRSAENHQLEAVAHAAAVAMPQEDWVQGCLVVDADSNAGQVCSPPALQRRAVSPQDIRRCWMRRRSPPAHTQRMLPQPLMLRTAHPHAQT